ncbi:MAG: hypothetical protein ACI4QL_01355 [Candidatus Fimimonas sp.]
MKIWKKIISIAMGIVLALLATALVGCDKTPVDDNKPDGDEQSFVYADFEQWAPDFQLIRVGKYSGSVSVNKDPAYSSEGKGQSCLFRPVGSYASKSTAKFVFPTYSTEFSFNYRDFSDVQSISFSFFNAEDKEVKVGLGLTPTITSIDTSKSTEPEWHVLPSKVWTTLEYKVNQTALGFLYDVTKIDGFYVEFENLGSRDIEDAPHVYLDDVVFNKYLVTPPMGEGLRINGMEFLDFEDELQNEAVSCDGPANCKPEGKIVKASDCGITATSGEYVYSLTFTPGERNDGLTWSWMIVSNLVTKSSLLNKVDSETAKDLVISIDIYNDTDEVQYLEFDFLYYEMAIFNSLELKPKQWTTFKFSMKPVIEKFGDFAEQGVLRIVYPEYVGDSDRRFFIDNIYFEWASECKPATIA